jgi:predicted ester cyclase
MSSEESAVRRFWHRVWTEGEVDHAHDFFAAEYLQNESTVTPARHATDALAFRTLFPDLSVEVVRILGRGDVVVTRVRYRGTYAGGVPGIHPAGQRIDVRGVDVFRFEDGKVVEHLHEADHEALWEQLGVALPPE